MIRCAHCKDKHDSVAQVRFCAQASRREREYENLVARDFEPYDRWYTNPEVGA